MKKDKNDSLRSEYSREDFGSGVRGKYYEEYQKGTNLVLLNPDIADVFHTEEEVNEALRTLIEVAQKTAGTAKHID